MENQENLEKIMERKVDEVNARFFYPQFPTPELSRDVPNGSADIISMKTKVNPDFINMLNDNGIPPEESLDEVLSHETIHLTRFPGTAEKRMHQYLIARQILEKNELGEAVVYAFNEAQTNIFNGVDMKNKYTPKVQRVLTKDSKDLNKVLDGLYQELFKEDLGVRFNWRKKKEKDLVKKLKEINFTSLNEEDQNLKKFIEITKNYLKTYKPESNAGFLGMFTNEQIQQGLDALALECADKGYTPNQFEQLASELTKEGKIIPGVGNKKAELIESRNIYLSLARNYSIPIIKMQTEKNGSLVPVEQKQFSIGTPIKDLNPFSSKGILPGITKAWIRKEGETIKELGIPDLVLVQDNSPSMPNPNEVVSVPVLGSSVISRTYILNDKPVTIYSFGSSDYMYGPSKDEEEVNKALRLHSGREGGTTFNPNKLEFLLKEKSKPFDLAVVSDMEISNLADFILSIKSMPKLHRIHLVYTNPIANYMAYVNEIINKTKGMDNIGYLQLFTKDDIGNIAMGELRKSLK